MFNHLLSYRFKQLLKNKSIIFWSLFFPIILACFFKMAFSNLDDQFTFNTIPVAVVKTIDSPENQRFTDSLKTAKNDQQAIFKVSTTDKVTADNALKENKISGYYLLEEEAPLLVINNNGFNQTFLKDFLQQFTYITAAMGDIVREKPDQFSESLVNDLLNAHTYTEKTVYGENEPKSTTLYFFTVIAMACMFGMNWGIKNSSDLQADQSPKGLRMSMSPVNKSTLIFTNLLAAFLIFFGEMLLVLGFIRFVLRVDFGNRWSLILLTCLMSCLLSISLGSLVGSGIKGNFNLKSTIVTTVSVFGGFLSGMMFPDVKYWIDQHAPIIAWLNPTSLITDALYKLFYYTDLTSFFMTIGMMFIMTVVINIANYLIMRRQAYADI